MKSELRQDICMHIDINKEIHDKELAHNNYRDGQAQDLKDESRAGRPDGLVLAL